MGIMNKAPNKAYDAYCERSGYKDPEPEVGSAVKEAQAKIALGQINPPTFKQEKKK